MKTTSKVQKVAIAIRSIEADRFGQLVVVAQPNEHNQTGNYVLNAVQEQFLLQRAGVPNRMVLKHLVASSNGTCKLEYNAQFNKAGEAWDNGKEGAAHKSGTYTKDWTQFSGYGVSLSTPAAMLLAEWSFRFGAAVAPVVADKPVTVSQPENEDPQTPETPTV